MFVSELYALMQRTVNLVDYSFKYNFRKFTSFQQVPYRFYTDGWRIFKSELSTGIFMTGETEMTWSGYFCSLRINTRN